MLARIHPQIHNDPYATILAQQITALHKAAVPVSEIVAAVVADGPLPVEQPAAALWWRLSRHLNPAEPIVTHPNSSTNSSQAGGMLANNPAGAHDAHPVVAGPEIAADVAEDRGPEQHPTLEATHGTGHVSGGSRCGAWPNPTFADSARVS